MYVKYKVNGTTFKYSVEIYPLIETLVFKIVIWY